MPLRTQNVFLTIQNPYCTLHNGFHQEEILIASTKWILYGTKLILYSTKRILITKLHFFVTKCNFIGLIKIHFVPQKIISRTQLTFLLDEIHCVWYSMGFVWLKTHFVCVKAWIGWKLHLDTWLSIEKSWVSSTTKLRRFLATPPWRSWKMRFYLREGKLPNYHLGKYWGELSCHASVSTVRSKNVIF